MSGSVILEFFLFARNDLFKHQFVFFTAILMLFHEAFDPLSHGLFRDSTACILLALLKYVLDVVNFELLGVSAEFLGQVLLVEVEDHHGKVFGLVLIQIVTVVDIVLLPDLLDDVVDQLFVLRLPTELEQELGRIQSLLVVLPDEDSQQDLRHYGG